MMKKILIAFLLLVGGSTFAQTGVKAEGNTLTTREIAPVWPGCEGSEATKKTCFKQKLVEHLKANYKYPRDADGKIIRGKAIVSFNINEEGKVEILSVKGAEKDLNAEAKRIILAIPVMTPGERAGKPVPIKYTVPFTF
jgi:periplasmic protein TonB